MKVVKWGFYRISMENLSCGKVGPSILSEYESCMTAITVKMGFFTEFRWEICHVVKWNPLFNHSICQSLLGKVDLCRISFENRSFANVK